MSNRGEVKAGDVVELNVRFRVHSIEHFDAGAHGPAFTALTYAVGEPREDGKVNQFTFEVPNEFGRIIILNVKEES